MGEGLAAAVGLHAVCCGLLPLVLIAGVSLAALAWAGAALAAVVAVAAAAYVLRRRRARACCVRERADATPPRREHLLREEVLSR